MALFASHALDIDIGGDRWKVQWKWGARNYSSREIAALDGSEAVVGVDAEAEDRGDFDRLVAAHGGLNFQPRRAARTLRSHLGRAGFEHAHILQVAGSIERAGHHHAGVRQAVGQIGADAMGAVRSPVGLPAADLVGKLHHHRAQRSIEIGGVFLALQQILVRLEGSAGSCCGDDGYSSVWPCLIGGMRPGV